MSSRRSLAQQQPHDLDEVYTTSSRLKYEARQHLRTRPRRVMVLLFAAAFVSVILFPWQHSLPVDYVQVQHYECPLDSQTLSTCDLCESLPLPTHAVTTVSPSIHTVIEPPVEPVVFSLIMHSEPSAKEGAVLLKVYFIFLVQLWPLSRITNPVSLR